MIGTVKISLYCPSMTITHVGGKTYRTAVENMDATLTFPDGSVAMLTPVVIPATDVVRHLLSFPTIATVQACEGTYTDDKYKLLVQLPEEPVAFEDTANGWALVAKAIVAKVTLMMDGEFGVGSVVFPDCPIYLLSGGASAVTAEGSVVFG